MKWKNNKTQEEVEVVMNFDDYVNMAETIEEELYGRKPDEITREFLQESWTNICVPMISENNRYPGFKNKNGTYVSRYVTLNHEWEMVK